MFGGFLGVSFLTFVGWGFLPLRVSFLKFGG